jgi:hypothetical protein
MAHRDTVNKHLVPLLLQVRFAVSARSCNWGSKIHAQIDTHGGDRGRHPVAQAVHMGQGFIYLKGFYRQAKDAEAKDEKAEIKKDKQM